MSVQKYTTKTIFSQCHNTKDMYGFLLIEIMAAVAFMSCIMMLVAQYCWHISQWQREAQMYAHATTLINQIIEKIKIDHKLPKFLLEKDSISVTCLEWPNQLIEQGPINNTRFLNNFSWIEIRASWKTTRNKTQSLLVYTGIELA